MTIVRLATSLWQGVGHLVLPGVCLACHELLPPERNDFCSDCERLFNDEANEACPRCGSTVGPYTDLADGCGRCRGERFAFERAVRLGPYEGGLRELVLRMKSSGGDALAEAVGERWAARVGPKLGPFVADMVVPVPLHWSRRWRRGFNQSELLARALARRLGVPCRPGSLRRVRPTAKQSTLSPTARWENVRGAFRAAAGAEFRGRAVLLVDDVLTSGSTAHEAARALRGAGAAAVAVAFIAKGG